MKVFELTEQVKHDLLPGVVDVSKLADWFWDEVHAHGVNLSELEYIEEFRRENGREPEGEDWDNYYGGEENWLIGGWSEVHGKNGLECFTPTLAGEGFAASIGWLGGAPIVTVELSTYYTTVRSMCSPCCPGQADLDSGYQEGGYACYSLPSEFYREEK